MTDDRDTPPVKPVLQASSWRRRARSRRLVLGEAYRELRYRWHCVWSRLRLRGLSPAKTETAAELALEEHARQGEHFDGLAEHCAENRDPDGVAIYTRAAQLARERRLTAFKRLHAANVPPASRASLPRTGSREFRPQRRASKALASSGDDPPPDDPEPSSSRSLGRLSRGRLGVEWL